MKVENALGIHPEILSFRAQRTQVLANNIANADTPNYKSKDILFKSIVNEISELSTNSIEVQTKYRVPYQRSLDGNTVELSVEQSQFAQNLSDYHTSLTFLKMKISGLRSAIEGK